MAFFRNDAVNRVNLHYGIQAFAEGGGAVFFLAFLLRAGVPVPATLLAQAAILLGRFAFRPALLPLAKRIGLKPTLIVGTLGVALQYPLLAQVHGVGPALFVLCLVSSLGDIFYWSSYHAYFAALGDAEHRGHQIGAREALVAVVGIVAPLAGAASLVALGPMWTFSAIGVIQALAAVPLLGAPNVAVKREAPGALRAARMGVALFVADGWFVGCFVYVWQVALFVTLRESVSAFGGAMALAALVGAVAGMVLGRHIDAGHGWRTVLIAYGAAILVMALRAASVGVPWLAVLANAPGGLVSALLSPALMTAVYNLSKASPCPLRFQIAAEGGWDVGSFCACLVAAAIAAAGLSLSYALLLTLVGAGGTVALLGRYYAGRLAAAADQPSPSPAPLRP